MNWMMGACCLPTNNGMIVALPEEDGNYSFDFTTFAAFPEYTPTVIRVEGDAVWIRSQNSLMKYDPNVQRKVEEHFKPRD